LRSQVTTADFVIEIGDQDTRLRAADLLGRVVIFSLLGLIILTAIPYGTAHAWWKAVFLCFVFATGILWIIEGFLSGSWATGGLSVLAPLITLAAFSVLQTLPLPTRVGPVAGVPVALWYAVSADPYETRFFILQLIGLMLAGALMFRYAATEQRLRLMIQVIVGVAVATAIFGIVRQTTQHNVGFGLPLIKPDQGYGQFINKNHFAFLMEMAFGLALGMIVGRGVKREQALIYVAALLPVWTALVLCNSRGGLVAMLAQVISAALLFTVVVPTSPLANTRFSVRRIANSLLARVVLLLLLVMGVIFGTIWLGGDRLVNKLEEGRAEVDPAITELRENARRDEIWRATWQMFEAHPIAGVGLGGYWTAIPTYHDASGTLTPQEAHNDYLELLASGGIIGLAIGVWFGVVVFKRTRANLRSPDRFRRAACFGAAIGIIGVAVHSLFDFGLHLTVNALVLTALIVIATGLPGATKFARVND
jgi:putative inorganic carbon (HCO3(-)) transporter